MWQPVGQTGVSLLHMWWRYLKAQLLVLLCGGLVGPIFLGVYFAMGPQAELKWMFYTGLLVTFGDVLVALVLTNFGAKSTARKQFLEQHGVLAMAQVTGMHETGTRVNNQPLVKLDLHIEGPGLAAFDTQDRVLASVTRLPMISSGKLAVLVDPATNDYQIDWQRSALLAGAVPAQFTLAEDNREPRDVPEARSAGERLQELDALRRSGAVTDEEYNQKRQQIIADL